ncbi:nucleoside-diphosphate kinase [Mesorhizobium sp. M7A.F.Ca.US.014.04.1.1]|uniref:nucleoside-diphosphate kinase n=3 Tax=Phyllobacteriaceae TaxID=69277 RepID=UPI0009ECD0E0|nr:MULTISPECIES: nucleoside-diphosphate kinase [Mesorhizobium]MDF3209383.1 nucleoside-diphosphate kinase [Mesorhizobium sp. LMG15046]MDF3234188.1 nucleoside-diphosphate kinase [Mesorhizobium sp. DSM 30133]RUU18498.1 nucleoside-diphosphate kinase [Mesorhizobium sp. Primo-B]RUU38652.1 nucleoside-diphosphate kinase [Mesorhizobium sp. Primo-A]RUX35504.1 nucleoside-diphosphate kinase [Mesorhizobium sp. M7A.F.Ca.CA.002.11.2.1]
METVMTGANFQLTTKDFAVLEIMLERRRAFADPIVPMLEDKLSKAEVVAMDSVGSDIVTLNSRLVFRVDAGPAQTRTLVQNEVRGPVGSSLSIMTRRGLCMLGMAEGQTAWIEQADGRRESVLIATVLYQPEAARRAVREKSQAEARRPHGLTLVYSAAADWRPLGERAGMRQTGDDDPGPAAA